MGFQILNTDLSFFLKDHGSPLPLEDLLLCVEKAETIIFDRISRRGDAPMYETNFFYGRVLIKVLPRPGMTLAEVGTVLVNYNKFVATHDWTYVAFIIVYQNYRRLLGQLDITYVPPKPTMVEEARRSKTRRILQH